MTLLGWALIQYGGGGGEVAQSCPTLAAAWTVTCQAPLSMGFSRQQYWSRLPFPSLGDLPNPGLNLGFLRCKQILYRLSYEVSPNPIWPVLYKEIRTQTQRGDHIETQGESDHYKPAGKASEETNTAHTLISDFKPPELWENKFLLFHHPFCGTL